MRVFHFFPVPTDKNYDFASAVNVAFVLAGKRIGDNIAVSFFLREFKKNFPLKKLTVCVEAQYSCILKNSGYAEIKILPRGFLRCLSFFRKGRFDVIIELPGGVDHHRLLAYYFSGAKAVVLERTEEYSYPFAKYIERDFHSHITEFIKKPLFLFGHIKDVDTSYEIPEGNERMYYADNLKNGMKMLLFNPEGNSPERTLSPDKVRGILEFITRNAACSVVLLVHNNKYAGMPFRDFFACRTENIMDIFALVKASDYVLTVDTCTVHIAELYKKRMTAVYRVNGSPDDENLAMWRPRTEADIITVPGNVNNADTSVVAGSVVKNLQLS